MGFVFIISRPQPLQIHYTYTQQLTSGRNVKSLSADQLSQLNRKFNLMDIPQQNFFSVMFDNNADKSDDCTIGFTLINWNSSFLNAKKFHISPMHFQNPKIENIIEKKMQQDHPCVIDYLRKNYMKKPPPPGTPRKLTTNNPAAVSRGQDKVIIGLRKKMVCTEFDFSTWFCQSTNVIGQHFSRFHDLKWFFYSVHWTAKRFLYRGWCPWRWILFQHFTSGTYIQLDGNPDWSQSFSLQETWNAQPQCVFVSLVFEFGTLRY